MKIFQELPNLQKMVCNGCKSAEEKELREAKAKTPDLINAHIRKLERELFHTWAFVMEEGLYPEALEYVNEHKDEETPLEW